LEVVVELNLALALLKNGETPSLLFLGQRVVEMFGGGVGARGKFEAEHLVILRGVEQREGVGKFGIGFSGEADDNVGGDADGAAGGTDEGDFLEIFVARVG